MKSSLVNPTPWFERSFQSGNPPEMLPLALERLEGTLVRIPAKLKNITEEDASKCFNEKWSIQQHIGHLSEVEEIAHIRFREIIEGVSPMTSAIQPAKADYNSMQLEDVFLLFKNARIKSIDFIDTVNVESLSLLSVHPRIKIPMNLVDLACFHAEHDDHHLVAITRILINL